MSGCAVTYNGSEETLPHSVIIEDGPMRTINQFLTQQGCGHYDIVAYQTSVNSNRWEQRYRFRFSDPDTAFWFRMKFV